MPIEVDCNSCGQQLRAPDNATGKAIRCPNCQNVMDVPAAATAPPPILTPGSNPSADAHASSNPYASSNTAGNTTAAGAGVYRPVSGAVIGVAVVNFILAALTLGCGTLFIAADDEIDRELSRQLGGMNEAVRQQVAIVMTVFAIVCLVYGVLSIIGGVGLLKRQQWGRILTFVLASINILFALLSILSMAQGNGGAIIFLAVCVGYAIFAFSVLASASVSREFQQASRYSPTQ